MPEEFEAGSSKSLIPHISAFAGDMNTIVPYLRAGGPVSHCDENENTILHAAVEGWQHRMVEFLILWGAEVNAQNKNGDTPLHTLVRKREVPFEGQFLKDIAPEQARKKTFFMLLLHRADTTILNVQGGNALHLAAHEGDLLAIDELVVRARKSVDALTSKGATALLLAILEDHVACARHLIASGADVNFDYKAGVTPLRLMYSSENAEMRALAEDVMRSKPEQ